MSEARKFMRTDFGVKGWLEHQGEKFDFDLINLSLKGALVHSETAFVLKKGNLINVTIQLTHSDVQICAEAELVHKEAKDGLHYMGCKFKSIDAESMIHLRRLLELNTQGEGEIEKELSFLKEEG